MSALEESVGAKTEFGAGLAEGVNTLSLNQTVTFTLYVKIVLPVDGYVFWANALLLTDSAILNASQFNALELNKNSNSLPARQITAQGSLHYSTEVNQQEDKTAAFNHMMFTSLQQIQDFNEVNPLMIYVATNIDGVKFAFNRRDSFYKQADLYHYRGDALYSVMYTQLIDSMSDFDSLSPVVSNSLPIFLSLNKFFPMFPSFLVEQNLKPPYASVHIAPSDTYAIQAFPLLDRQSNPFQLVHDKVKITIYGKRNQDALNFAQYLYDYSLNTDNFGVQNMPIIQDEKLTQTEFGIIAMKKTIILDISYYQTTVNNVARKLIESAFVSYTVTPYPTQTP